MANKTGLLDLAMAAGLIYVDKKLKASNASNAVNTLDELNDVTEAKKGRKAETVNKVSEPKYIPKDVTGKEMGLPTYGNGDIVNGTVHKPDSMLPHSQIGYKKGRKEKYIQTLEWGYDGEPIQRTDWTNHGRGDHINPHTHPANLKNGSWSFKD